MDTLASNPGSVLAAPQGTASCACVSRSLPQSERVEDSRRRETLRDHQPEHHAARAKDIVEAGRL